VSAFGWSAFKSRAVGVALDRAALVRDRGDAVEFLHPRTNESVRISIFETDQWVMIRAGWFIRIVVDIDTPHMLEQAISDLAAIFDGGAVEYIGIADGQAAEAGYDVVHSDGARTGRAAVDGVRRLAAHRLSPWAGR
jgi:hypothetical protein